MWLALLFMILPGVVSFIAGIVLLCLRHPFKRHRPPAEGWVDTDQFVLQYRISAGLGLLTVSAFCLLSAWDIWKALPH